jgi:predicted ribosomally synthesized peptide with nif11-like leader
MAKETVARLLEAAKNDEALRHRLEDAQSASEVVEIGAELGFEFSAEELQDALDELRQASEAELPEEELQKVAGGFGDPGMVKRYDGISLAKPVPALPFNRGFIRETIRGFKS